MANTNEYVTTVSPGSKLTKKSLNVQGNKESQSDMVQNSHNNAINFLFFDFDTTDF